MTAYTWVGGTGDWDVGGNWSPSSPAGPPTATDTATISATGSAYTVTIDSADVAQSLTESSASATVDDTDSLTLSSTFALSAGTFILGLGGNLSGGTTKLTGGTFACDGGTLSGVTYDGTLDLSSGLVHIASGTVVNTAAGKAGGTIDIGEYSTIYFDGTQTFNNATINLGTTSRGNSTLIEHGAGTVLTLGSNVTIDESGHAGINTGGSAGDGIVDQGNISQTAASGGTLHIAGNSFTNSGTITAASSGGALLIETTTFANSGTLAVSNGEPVTIDATNFSNTATGVIAVGANSTLNLTPGGSWSNLGSITLAGGSSLVLGGGFTLAGLGTLTNSGGTVYVKGTLDNTGTLNGLSGLGQAVLDGGIVQGGAVTSSALGFSSSGGTLSGVTYDGTLDLSGSGASVYLTSGTVVNNAPGTGAGTINDTGDGSDLYFDNTQTFNNVTINLGNTSDGYSLLTEDDSTGAGAVLTLGSGVTIDERGQAYIETSGYAGDGIVNQGKINQTAGSGNLHIQGNSFTNSGTIAAASTGRGLTIETTTFTNSGAIDVSNDETVTIEPTTFTNLSGATLIGGAYTVGAGSDMELADNTTIVTDDANITLSGAGSLIQSYDRATGDQVSFDSTLRMVGASGELHLLADRSLTTAAAAIGDNGLIQLGGGTLTVTGTGSSLDITGELEGFGVVDATTLANSGEIEASGGTLTVQNAITGTGADTISGRATLEFAAKVAAGQTASFTGSGGELILHDPAAFAGSIGGFDTVGAGSNDTIQVAPLWDFTGFTENAAGTEGTLGFMNGASTLSLTLIGDYNSNDFVHQTGPHGSTRVTYT